MSKEDPSPPEFAQPTPFRVDFRRLVVTHELSALFITNDRGPYISRIDIDPSTLDLSVPNGFLILVAFAAQGVIKKAPISSISTPCSLLKLSLAIWAAISMGD